MTSQIAILNLDGAVVASDSMLTVETATSARNFTSQDKLFALGEPHKVVCLVSGSARFVDIPWTVIIGAWKQTLEDLEPLAEVEEYWQHLLEWLPNQERLFPPKQQSMELLRLVTYQYLALSDYITAIFEDEGLTLHGGVDEVDHERLTELVETFCAHILQEQSYEDLAERVFDEDLELINGLQPELAALVDETLGFLPMSESIQEHLFVRIPQATTQRAQPESPATKVVFLGYGVDEVFPHLVSVDVESMFGNTVRHLNFDHTSVKPGDEALLQGLAQSDAIFTFVRGIHQQVRTSLPTAVGEFLSECIGHRFNETELEDLVASTAEHVEQTIHHLTQTTFVEPLINAVGSMPLAEMARLAESLVGIQALRSASEVAIPSVGGDIRVAIVTKADGVLFVK